MSDQFGVKARIEAFDKRNGGHAVLRGEWFYYSNGAIRERDLLGALIDPPEDEFQRLTNILHFHEARHAEAVRAFDNWQERLLMSGEPDRDALDELRRLRDVVGERNEDVNQAKAALAGTERSKRLAAGRRLDAEMQQQRRDFKDEVRAIKI